MKNRFFKVASLIGILLLIVSCNSLVDDKETIIDIKDVRGMEMPSPNLDIHQYKDIEIYRWNIASESSYVFNIYRFENDSLQRFIPISFDIDDDFKKAAYIWNSDTVLLVRFYNMESEKELKFRLSGDLLNITGSGTTRCEVLNINDFNP